MSAIYPLDFRIAMSDRITNDGLLIIVRYVTIYNRINILDLSKNWTHNIFLFCSLSSQDQLNKELQSLLEIRSPDSVFRRKNDRVAKRFSNGFDVRVVWKQAKLQPNCYSLIVVNQISVI